MRYLNVDTVTFTTINGYSVRVKDVRPIEQFAVAFVIPLAAGDMLDEIASRADVWGDGAEGMAYAILDANAEKFVENGFDVSKVRTIAIPAVEG